MQKLILQYTIGDDCTWSSDITSPFLYSCKEDAIIEFMALVEEQKTTRDEFIFAGLKLTAEPFAFLEKDKMVCWGANIKTLEEWFEQELPK